MPSWSQKIEARTFRADFCTRNFWGGVSRYAATPLIVALSPGHSDIIRFCPWSPITTGNHLDRAEKESISCSHDWHRWRFWSAFRHFGTHFAESFPMSKSSRMMDPTRSHEMPSCSAIDLGEIRQSSKISSWIWSIISGVVTVLRRPGRCASQVENSPRLNWATQFLTLAYDGACSPDVFFQNGANFLRRFALQEKKLDDSSRLDVVEIGRVALTCFLSASVTRKYLQFGTWTDPSFQLHYRFRDTSGSRSG